MIVLLHSDHPWNVVECHGTQSEVGVIRNLANFLDEAIEVGRRNAVDSSQEVSRSKSIMVGGRTAALQALLVINLGQNLARIVIDSPWR